MGCETSHFPRIARTTTSVVAPPAAILDQFGPSLLVSNSPEKLTDAIFASQSWANLYVSPVINPSGTSRFRVFLWHANYLDWVPLISPIKIHLGVFLQATNGHVNNRAVDEFQWLLRDDISVPSTCLASAQLFGTLDELGGTITPTGDTLIWQTTIGQEQHPSTFENDPNVLGAVLEFDASGSDILIRTVATLDANQWGNNYTAPVDESAPVHPRGFWPYSGLIAQVQLSTQDAYDVNPFGHSPPIQYCSVCNDSSSLEHGHLGFGWRTLVDPYGRANVGCYGADLEYRFLVTNTSETNAYPCYVGMRARNTGSKYWGAAQVTRPSAWTETEIDKIPLVDDSADPEVVYAAYDLLHARNPNYFTVAPQQSVTVAVRLANGGSATLPVNLFVSRLDISTEEPEVPEP